MKSLKWRGESSKISTMSFLFIFKRLRFLPAVHSIAIIHIVVESLFQCLNANT